MTWFIFLNRDWRLAHLNIYTAIILVVVVLKWKFGFSSPVLHEVITFDIPYVGFRQSSVTGP